MEERAGGEGEQLGYAAPLEDGFLRGGRTARAVRGIRVDALSTGGG